MDETADLLRVSRTTVYRYLERGLFPGAWQTEQAWRIPRADIEAYKRRGSTE